MKPNLHVMTVEEFKAIPRTLTSPPTGAVSAVVVVEDEIHDSGYRCVSLVFFDGSGELLGRTVYGHDHVQVYVLPQEPLKVSGYENVEMDWLPTSRLMRFWLREGGFDPIGLLMSSASLRPGKTDSGVKIHSDRLKDVKRHMAEWVEEFGAEQLAAEQLAVALDEVLGK